jgi:DNA excision repair protein ERCC-4
MKTPTPTIIIDTREQTPLVFASLPTERATLVTGDYSIKGFERDFSVERKSVADLVQSVTRERDRFSRELQRMRAFDFRRLLIVGALADIEAHRYRSQANPKSVIASVTAFEIRYQLPVCYCPTPEAAATQIERWATFFLREQLNAAADTLRRYGEQAPTPPPPCGSFPTLLRRDPQRAEWRKKSE